MNESLHKDLVSIAHYLRMHEQISFREALQESGIAPREGLEPSAWAERRHSLLMKSRFEADFVSELDSFAADTEGHIYCAMVRVEQALIDAPVHPDAGLGLFVVSGREHGDDDDTVDEIVAASAADANVIFEAMLVEQSDDDEPTIYLNTNSLVGVFDRYGKLEVGAKLPAIDRDNTQVVEPTPDYDAPGM